MQFTLAMASLRLALGLQESPPQRIKRFRDDTVGNGWLLGRYLVHFGGNALEIYEQDVIVFENKR